MRVIIILVNIESMALYRYLFSTKGTDWLTQRQYLKHCTISSKDHPFYICVSCPLMRDGSLRVLVYMWGTTQQEKQISVFAMIVECRDQILSSFTQCFSFTDDSRHWPACFINEYRFLWHLPQTTEPHWLSIQYGLNLISSIPVCVLIQVLSSCWYHH